MKNISILNTTAFAIFFLVLGLILAFSMKDPKEAVGSALVGNDYMATSSSPSSFIGTGVIVPLKTGGGSLAQVVVNVAGSAGGSLVFYDATTTDINLRAATQSTSSIFITALPNALVAGTYTFDAQFSRGLLMHYTGGAVARASTTVMYR